MPRATMHDLIEGPYGKAVRVTIPEVPEAVETLNTWLITAPAYHPAWQQYLMACVRLRDNVPGFDPPRRKFEGTTHEVMVYALDPEHGPYSATIIGDHMLANRGLPLLHPVNVVEQFIATDGEMLELTELLAAAVVHGVLTPETADDPDTVRLEWLSSATKTLAHIRGEEHAS